VWEVFTSPHAQRDCVREYEHLQHLGISSRLIPTDVVTDSESILNKSACAVVELQEDFGLDPELLWHTLRDLNPHSTLIGNTTVDSITPTHSGTSVIVQAGDRAFTSAKVVIAAGAWTPGLTRKLGLKLPIIAAKGYSITIEHPEHNAVHPMILADEKTAIDPIGDSLRLSARFELTRPNDRRIDHKRIRQIYARAQSALKLPPIPDSLESLTPWTGVRPASADGAPFIGPLAHSPNILVAAGHGMIGTTMAIGTADLIARYVRQEEVSTAERALSPNR
jgi:D-amino-acid dehydrogenase